MAPAARRCASGNAAAALSWAWSWARAAASARCSAAKRSPAVGVRSFFFSSSMPCNPRTFCSNGDSLARVAVSWASITKFLGCLCTGGTSVSTPKARNLASPAAISFCNCCLSLADLYDCDAFMAAACSARASASSLGVVPKTRSLADSSASACCAAARRFAAWGLGNAGVAALCAAPTAA